MRDLLRDVGGERLLEWIEAALLGEPEREHADPEAADDQRQHRDGARRQRREPGLLARDRGGRAEPQRPRAVGRRRRGLAGREVVPLAALLDEHRGPRRAERLLGLGDHDRAQVRERDHLAEPRHHALEHHQVIARRLELVAEPGLARERRAQELDLGLQPPGRLDRRARVEDVVLVADLAQAVARVGERAEPVTAVQLDRVARELIVPPLLDRDRGLVIVRAGEQVDQLAVHPDPAEPRDRVGDRREHLLVDDLGAQPRAGPRGLEHPLGVEEHELAGLAQGLDRDPRVAQRGAERLEVRRPRERARGRAEIERRAERRRDPRRRERPVAEQLEAVGVELRLGHAAQERERGRGGAERVPPAAVADHGDPVVAHDVDELAVPAPLEAVAAQHDDPPAVERAVDPGLVVDELGPRPRLERRRVAAHPQPGVAGARGLGLPAREQLAGIDPDAARVPRRAIEDLDLAAPLALVEVGDLLPERRARVGDAERIGRDPDAALVLPQPRREERHQRLEEILLRSIELTEMVAPRHVPDRRHPRGTERHRGRTCSRH